MKFSNVTTDARSIYQVEQMVQRDFVTQMFASLADDLGASFHDYEFFIYSSNDVHSTPASADLPGRNKVLLFLTDQAQIPPMHLAPHYAHVFKTHMACDSVNNVHPLNLGFPDSSPPSPRPMAERPIDIFFQGNLNANRYTLYRHFNPLFRILPEKMGRLLLRVLLRTGLARHVLRHDYTETRKGLNYRVVFTNGFMAGVSPDAFQQLLADSRVVLCPIGFVSPQSFRHSEALRAGSVAVTEALPDTVHYRGSPFVTVTDWRDGLATAEAIARDPARAQALHEQALAWYQQHLSPAATARYIAQKLGSKAL